MAQDFGSGSPSGSLLFASLAVLCCSLSAMVSLGATSTSSCSLSSCAMWFGEVGGAVDPGPNLATGPFFAVEGVLGCAGAKTDRGPRAGAYTASAVDSLLFPGGCGAAKPVVAPPCIGIGDLQCCMSMNPSPSGAQKNVNINLTSTYEGNTGFEHLGNVNLFMKNIKTFCAPKGEGAPAPSYMHEDNSNQNKKTHA